MTLLADLYQKLQGQTITMQEGHEGRLREEQEKHAKTQSKLDFAHHEIDRAIQDHASAQAEATMLRGQQSARELATKRHQASMRVAQASTRFNSFTHQPQPTPSLGGSVNSYTNPRTATPRGGQSVDRFR